MTPAKPINTYSMNVATLLDLPNEILIYILKKFDNIEVLCSLFSMNNERLLSIARDQSLSSVLNLELIVQHIPTFDAFCNHILQFRFTNKMF